MSAGAGLRPKAVVEVKVSSVLITLRVGQRPSSQCPKRFAGDPGADLDAICPGLAFDLRPPSVRVLDLIDRENRLTGGEQLAVGVSPPHPLDEPFDSPLDLDGILHTSMLRRSLGA